jgi:alginate O-acetyltransferase complex protein AlgI
MLFNSYEFIFIFLPIVLLGFHLIGRQEYHRVAIAWLVGASLFFYGWWNPAYLGLMLFSTLFNYSVGVLLGSTLSGKLLKKIILTIGVSINLLVLGYYKYANFFVDSLNAISGTNIVLHEVILPLAISFFTFQQIAYLVDAYKDQAKEYNFLHYCLFVTFFPQLIAGPIVHHKEILPQFLKDTAYKVCSKNLAIGITIFALGLFKKVVLADGMSVYSTPVFDAAESEVMLTFFEAWAGALSYTFQLYFDFSGYSDMAIGIARMFGIRLPLNFNSPYKATSIIDFWKRWHMTLSRFLRDYLYIPLGGSKKGKLRRYVNLMITMLLGGLWHGAGWTFVLWGTLHGFFLIVNHAWRALFSIKIKTKASLFIAWMITFLAIVVSWVPFRAESFEGVKNILNGMIGLNGFIIPQRFLNTLNKFHDFGDYLLSMGVELGSTPFFRGNPENLWIILLFIMFMPNTQQFMSNYEPALDAYKGNLTQKEGWIRWRPTVFWSVVIIIMFIFSIHEMSNISEFLYFQF